MTIWLPVATESLSQAYEPRGGFYDELFAATGAPRSHARTLADGARARSGPEALAAGGPAT